MEQQSRRFVAATLLASPWHLQTLRAVRELDLPDWAIGAGFVRNAVWDRLHGFSQHTPLSDIDVLFFDPADPSPAREESLAAALVEILSGRPWSVRNQARMHRRNADRPYRCTEDAMSFWLETPTCVAVRLDHADRVKVISPFGLSDLLAMRSAPTVAGLGKIHQYRARMRAKNWPSTWPRVTVAALDSPAAAQALRHMTGGPKGPG